MDHVDNDHDRQQRSRAATMCDGARRSSAATVTMMASAKRMRRAADAALTESRRQLSMAVAVAGESSDA
jgi:hypothetical protein